MDIQDALDIWLSSGKDEDCTCGYSEEELEEALLQRNNDFGTSENIDSGKITGFYIGSRWAEFSRCNNPSLVSDIVNNRYSYTDEEMKEKCSMLIGNDVLAVEHALGENIERFR